MKLCTLEFERCHPDGSSWSELSKKVVRSYWNVPRDADVVWLVLHTRATDDSLPVKLQRDEWGALKSTPGFRSGRLDGSIGCHVFAIISAIGRPIIKSSRTVHVECYYEKF